MKKLVLFRNSLILVTSFLVLWGCSKTCDIKLKNGTTATIKVFTKKTGIESSVELKPGDVLRVGKCTDCAEINDEEIELDQMLVILGMDELEMKDKKEVLKFLNELKSEDCLVKTFQ